MIEEIKNIKSSKQDLRKFGFTVGIVLIVLGGILWWRGREFYVYVLVVGGLLSFFGWVWPVVLKPIQKVWMTLAVVLGWFMTRVILSVLFYLVFVPIGRIARLFGKDFLDLKLNSSAESYWIGKDTQQEKSKEAYEKQF